MCGDLVADEPNHACGREHPEVRQVLRMDEALDGFVMGNASGDEDREHDEESGDLLGADAAQIEGDGQRHRC